MSFIWAHFKEQTQLFKSSLAQFVLERQSSKVDAIFIKVSKTLIDLRAYISQTN